MDGLAIRDSRRRYFSFGNQLWCENCRISVHDFLARLPLTIISYVLSRLDFIVFYINPVD